MGGRTLSDGIFRRGKKEVSKEKEKGIWRGRVDEGDNYQRPSSSSVMKRKRSPMLRATITGGSSSLVLRQGWERRILHGSKKAARASGGGEAKGRSR